MSVSLTVFGNGLQNVFAPELVKCERVGPMIGISDQVICAIEGKQA